jgi:tripartite-type tricarboxylate transporter receptor subunit TctC
MRRRDFVAGLSAAAWGAPAFAAAGSDTYPSHPVTLVIPYTPGASTDLLGRMVAAGASEQLKQPFVVENRAGAASIVGATSVAQARPDGYTLLLAPFTTLAVVPNVTKNLSFDPIRDFAPVSLLGRPDWVLVAHPQIGVTTVSELITYVKQHPPGSLSYATGGFGSPHHMFMEMFLGMTGLKMQPVPYRGSVPAVTDVLAGHVPMMFVDMPPVIQFIGDGKLRALGVAWSERSTRMPDIPTIAEGGVPGFAARAWFSIVTRAGTPRPVIDTLNRAIVTYLTRADVVAKLRALAIEPLPSTPEELAELIRSESAKWARVAEDAGLEPQPL